MKPYVTVITVVRNDATHIRQTLDSVLAQVGVDIQYLILDGASTDGTYQLILEHFPSPPGGKKGGPWIHVSYCAGHNRQVVKFI